jgi:Zn-dependent protease with chaperone function
MSGLLEIAMLAASLLAAAVWVGVVVFVPAESPPSLPPSIRGARARMWLYAPLWLPMLVVASTTLPGLLAAGMGLGDHCTSHGGHVHHLCLIHSPHHAGHPLVWTLIALLLVSPMLLIGRAAMVGLTEWRLGAALARSSQVSPLGSDVRLVDSPRVMALTVGIVRPVVVLSTGLVQAVPPRTLDIVLAHERAHARRRDGAWAFLDSLVAGMLPARVRTHWLRELALAREHACDLAAASAEGARGRLRVAAALVEIARYQLTPPAFGMSVVGTPLEARVRCLLDDSPRSRGWLTGPVSVVVVAVALGAGPVHHLIEYVAAYLLH